MLIAALRWALAESSSGTLVRVGPGPAPISTVHSSCKRCRASGSFATLLVLQRVEILTILLSHNLAIQLFQLLALHDDLLSVFLATLNVVAPQVELIQSTHGRQQWNNFLLQIADPVTAEVQSLDPIAVVERLALNDLIIR